MFINFFILCLFRLLLTNPAEALNDALNLLERMRVMYTDRQDYRVDLIPILKMVQEIYEAIPDHEKVIEIGLEMFDVLGEPLKYGSSTDIYLPIIKAYKGLGQLDMAKKYAMEAFEWHKTKSGMPLEVFKLKFPEYAEFWW